MSSTILLSCWSRVAVAVKQVIQFKCSVALGPTYCSQYSPGSISFARASLGRNDCNRILGGTDFIEWFLFHHHRHIHILCSALQHGIILSSAHFHVIGMYYSYSLVVN